MRVRKYLIPVISGLAIFGAFKALPRDRILTSDATRLLNIKGWEAKSALLAGPSTIYKWLSSSRILHTRGISENDWTVALYNTEAKSDLGIPQALADILIDSSSSPWQVCSDGRKILIDKAGKDSLHMLACVDLSGRVIKEESTRPEFSAGWLDSNKYISWDYSHDNGHFAIRSVIHSTAGEPTTEMFQSTQLADATSRIYNFDSRELRQTAREIASNPPLMGKTDSLAAGGGRLIAIATDSKTPAIVVEEVGRPGAKRYPVTLPAGWDYLRYCVSPKGNWIAWVLTAEPMPRYSQLMSKMLPWFRGETPPRTGLWVSDWRGLDMREIGHIYETPRQAGATVSFDFPAPVIGMLEWLPNESGVSFVNKGELYLAGVN